MGSEMCIRDRKYLEWFIRYRDPKKTGLISILHPWESGYDNSPLWDKPMSKIKIDSKLSYKRKDNIIVKKNQRPLKGRGKIKKVKRFGKTFYLIDESYNSVTVQNIGWGAAYNVTTGNEIIEKVERNQVITLSKNSNVLQYNRLIHEGEEADLTLISMNLTSMPNPENETTPSIDFISITLSLVIVSALRRRK